jgi:xanthine/uracil/vitamin C permease (AzgA family)
MRAAIACGVGFFITMIGLKIGEIEQVSVAKWALSGSLDPVPYSAVTNGIAYFNANGAARLSILGLAFLAFFSTLRVPGAV